MALPRIDGPDPVAVAERVREAFDDDDAAALAAHITVGGRVEGLAFAVGRQHVRVREGHRGLGAEQRVRAAGQREVTFPVAQGLAGLMDRHQRRAARRVDGDRRALQPQPVADPARARGGRRPDRDVGLDFLVTELFRNQAQVVVGAQTHEHAGLGVRQRRRRGSRMLHRLPRRLQQQPMLRVDQHGLPVRQPEERRVEAGHVIDEPRPAGDDLAGRVGIRVVEFVDVPAVRGHFRDRVPPLLEHIPEFVRVGGTREARRVSDDRKTLGLALWFVCPHG